MRKKEDRSDSEEEEEALDGHTLFERSFPGTKSKSGMGKTDPAPIQEDDVVSDSSSDGGDSDGSNEDAVMIACEEAPPSPVPKKTGTGTSNAITKKRKAAGAPPDDDDDHGNDGNSKEGEKENSVSCPVQQQPAPKKPKSKPAPSPAASAAAAATLRLPLCRKVSDMVYRQVVPNGKLLEAAMAGCKEKSGSSSARGSKKPPKRTSFIFTEDNALRLIVKRVVREFPMFRDQDKAKDLVGKLLTILYDETHQPPTVQ
jgi:hypothetical protein